MPRAGFDMNFAPVGMHYIIDFSDL
jgi:hypothetical protein